MVIFITGLPFLRRSILVGLIYVPIAQRTLINLYLNFLVKKNENNMPEPLTLEELNKALEKLATKEDLEKEIEGLARLVKENFDKVDERLDKVDERLENMSAQLDLIQLDIADIKQKLAILEKRAREDADAVAADVLKLKKRVEALEKQVQILQASQSA
jgi:tetrahydromethanopterin S-methyltransferase subunit G